MKVLLLSSKNGETMTHQLVKHTPPFLLTLQAHYYTMIFYRKLEII